MESWWYSELDSICKAMKKPCHVCENLKWKIFSDGMKCHCSVGQCNFGKEKNDNAETDKIKRELAGSVRPQES